jgi:cell division protein FtsL
MNIPMENVTQIVQKVRQAHWRVQRQWIGLFLLGLVAVSMVAGLYLNVTVRATMAGRETQLLQSQLIDDRQEISDLETQLAGLTSVESMQRRAEDMGFRPASQEDFTYVVVPGYTPQTAVNMSDAGSASLGQTQQAVILSEYTESLFDWVTRKLISTSPAGAQQ